MWFRNKLFFFLIGCFTLNVAIFGEPEKGAAYDQIVLQADLVELDNTKKTLSATGNVLAKYREMNIKSDAFEYNFETKILTASGNFSYESGENYFQLHNLYYNGGAYEGSADRINGVLGRFIIKGGTLSINPKRIVIKNASFTTCDLPDPHYLVEASRIYVYPLFGFLVANDNYVRIRKSPVRLWIPTYFYGSMNYGLWSLTPFPRFGSTRREGFYARQGVPYSLNSQSHGNVDVGYTEKLGAEYSVTHLFAFNTSRQLMLKAGSVGKDGFVGGFIYREDLEQLYGSANRKKSRMGSTLFNSFTELTQLPKGVMTFESTWANLINNSRVDFIPRLKMDVNKFNLGDTPVRVSGSFESAKIHENTLTRVDINGSRTVLTGQLKYPTQMTKWVKTETNVDVIHHIYEGNRNWRRGFIGFSFIPKSPILKPRLSYSKQLFFSGSSPFEFDSAFIQQSDEVGIGLTQRIKNFEFNINAAYRTKTWEARQLEYSFTVMLHEIQLIVGFNDVQQSFFFGGSI